MVGGKCTTGQNRKDCAPCKHELRERLFLGKTLLSKGDFASGWLLQGPPISLDRFIPFEARLGETVDVAANVEPFESFEQSGGKTERASVKQLDIRFGELLLSIRRESTNRLSTSRVLTFRQNLLRVLEQVDSLLRDGHVPT